MEGVFYDALDAALSQQGDPGTGPGGYGTLRCNMTLNLHDPKPQGRGALTSPDLHLLKLTSPELERLILQSCSGLTPVLSPTPRFPPQEEGFGDGFARTLADLHGQQRTPGPGAEVPPAAACTFDQDAQRQVWDGYPDAPACALVPNALKEEPQRVPETPPLSPIDMEDQERIKAERKRMRNRVAASKCRKRKLERLARLEERVSRLSGENGELRAAAQALRDQVLQLRHELLDHVKSGCKQLSQQLHTVRDV